MGKIFYIPCGLSLFCAYLCHRRWDRLDMLMAIFAGWIFLTDLIQGIIPMCFSSPSIRIVLGIACFNGLRKTAEEAMIRYMTVVCVSIVFLSFYILVSPLDSQGRYFGYIGDPNYYALTLNLIVFILFQQIKDSYKCDIWVMLAVLSLTAVIPFFVAGQSRVGFISLIILLAGGIYTLHRRFRKISYAILFLSISAIICCMIFTDLPREFADRYAMKGLNGWAAMSRIYQIECVIDCIKDSPEIMLWGIGVDMDELSLPVYGECMRTIVHNTFVNVFFHQGIPGLVIFCLILFEIAKSVLLHRTDALAPVFFVTVLLNIMSVASVTYLSFWWSLFYMANRYDRYHDRDKKHIVDGA